jgi:site-specific recombinase XerD
MVVSETVVRGRHGALGFGEPKSAAGRRTLALPAALLAMVREQLAVKGVASSVNDEPTKKVRYEGLGFHDLRRARATGLLAEGVDVKTAQTLLGHSEARLTLDV